MITAVLLLMIGVADLCRGVVRGPRWSPVIGLVVVWLFAVLGLGLDWWWPTLTGLVALGWIVAMPSSDASRPRGFWPVLLLGLLVVASTLVFGAGGAADSPAAQLYAGFDLGVLQEVPLVLAVAAGSTLVFLTRSSNLIVRASLRRAREDDEPQPTAAPASAWTVMIRGRELGSVEQSATPRRPTTQLLGGRLIGPLERVFIVVLALSGTGMVIAALVAAKGIVRFPEISEDRGVGGKAEEFLVGSFTSWAIAAAAVLYLWVIAAG